MNFGWSCPLVITIAFTAVIFAKESDFSCRRFPLLVPPSQIRERAKDVITSAHFPYLHFDYISNLLRAVPFACWFQWLFRCVLPFPSNGSLVAKAAIMKLLDVWPDLRS